MHWFTKDWWAFLLAPKDRDYSWLEVVWCRYKGHPAGVIWYSSNLEPDMTCKGCGDDLG